MKLHFFSVLLATGVLMSCSNKEHLNKGETTFAATTVLQQDTVLNHEYVCQIRSAQHIELRALEKGYLQNIYVDEGQSVKKGDLLFQITPLLYKADLDQAAAEVSFAQIEYNTTKTLSDSNIVSANELALAKAKLDRAKANLAMSQAHLGFTEIRAPFDGMIGRFNDVRLGSLVDEGDLLTTLSDNSKMWVYFNLPEFEYLEYATNKSNEGAITVKLQMANGELFKEPGVIETIEADFNNETGNIAFRAAFANPDHLLRHGQTGNIIMPVRVANALLIPQKATFEILDKKFVYVLDATNTLRAREISVSAELPHLYIVSQGLQRGEKLLIDGIRKVHAGDHIEYSMTDPLVVMRDLNHLHAE